MDGCNDGVMNACIVGWNYRWRKSDVRDYGLVDAWMDKQMHDDGGQKEGWIGGWMYDG